VLGGKVAKTIQFGFQQLELGAGVWRAGRLSSVHRDAVLAVVLLLVGILRVTADATPFQQLPINSTSSRLARLDAIKRIPLDHMSVDAQRSIEYVISNPTLYRRITTKRLECDPDLFLFLARRPEVIVNIWELMGVTKMQVHRTDENTLQLDDGQGTNSSIELLYGTPTLHVVHADGVYQGPLFHRTLYAQCVFVMKTDYLCDPKGTQWVVCQLDIFARVKKFGADLMTRTLRPIVARIADYNFSESTRFVSQISQAACSNGPGVQRLARRLTGIDPRVRQQFSHLTAAVSDRAANRRRANTPSRNPGNPRLSKSLPTPAQFRHVKGL